MGLTAEIGFELAESGTEYTLTLIFMEGFNHQFLILPSRYISVSIRLSVPGIASQTESAKRHRK